MDYEKLYKEYNQATRLLADGRLGEAVGITTRMAEGVAGVDLKWKADELSDAYKMLLTYMGQGVEDEQRDDMYLKFINKCYEILDASYMSRMHDNTSYFFSTKRTLETLGETSVAKMALEYRKANGRAITVREEMTMPGAPERLSKAEQKKFPVMTSLFDAIWTSSPFDNEDYEGIRQLLLDELVTVADKAALLGALMLGGLFFYDERKMLILGEYANNEDLLLRSRSLTGLVLSYMLHYGRAAKNKNMHEQFIALSEDVETGHRFRSEVALLQMLLVMSLETQNIERKMREDIIPTVIKNAAFKPGKFGLDAMEKLAEGEDFNPDWIGEGAAKRIENYIKQLSDLQSQGADVYLGAFSTLKQRYPFFRSTVNWFYPFTLAHPQLIDKIDAGSFGSFFDSYILCDSDKYSFALMLSEVPSGQKDMMEAQFSALSEQGANMQQLGGITSMPIEGVMRGYLQSLYRFFKLFPYHRDMPDLFDKNLFLADYKPLDTLIKDSGRLEAVADVAFRYKNYDISAKFFALYEKDGLADASVQQKMGFVHQMAGEIAEATECYNKANLLKGNSVWTLRHLGSCYSTLGKHDKALQCYEEIETIEPDNLNNLKRIGEELIRCGQYDKALTYLYKVDYLSEEFNAGAARAIAWCSFLLKKPEQAEKYYSKILTDEPTAEDYVNAGHVSWSLHDVPMTVKRYAKAVRIGQYSDGGREFLEADATELTKYGITETDRNLMIDYLQMIDSN